MAETPSSSRRSRGFTHAGGLLSQRLRAAGAARGFSEARILTAWADIVGASLAAVARPSKVSYARGGMGATLTVLVEGARAPEVSMQLGQIRERVNACYGYNAISRVRITQTDRHAPGLAEPSTAFVHDAPVPEPEPSRIAALGLDNVKDGELRAALESLGKNVLRRQAKQVR